MNRNLNQFDKGDLPLDSNFFVEKSNSSLKNTKGRINAIGKSTKDKVINKNKIKFTTENEKNSIRSKLTKNTEDAIDLEQLNERNLTNNRSRSGRNKIVIAILIILLLLVIGGIVAYYYILDKSVNCTLHVSGNASAYYLIDDEQMTEFKCPHNIQGNRIYEFKTEIVIESSSECNMWFEIICYVNSERVAINPYELNTDFTYKSGKYLYDKTVKSGDHILLCKGVELGEKYENILNSNNFKLEIRTYFGQQ